MMPAIHRSALPDAAYAVPRPRATDAIGEALRGAHRVGGRLPDDMVALMIALDRIGRA